MNAMSLPPEQTPPPRWINTGAETRPVLNFPGLPLLLLLSIGRELHVNWNLHVFHGLEVHFFPGLGRESNFRWFFHSFMRFEFNSFLRHRSSTALFYQDRSHPG